MMSHKKVHRFLVETMPPVAIGAILLISDTKKVHQIYRVLRLEPGETIAVFCDGGPNIIGEIVTIGKSALELRITAIQTVAHPPRRLIAAVSIIKGDSFEIVTEKLTELGVDTIVPLISGRTVKQHVRIDRLQAISDEALEQCGGTRRVSITEAMDLERCLATYPFQKVVLNPLAHQETLESYSDTIVCFVGPEGGWNEIDEQLLIAAQSEHIRITNRVLRTETAAIVGAYTLLWSH